MNDLKSIINDKNTRLKNLEESLLDLTTFKHEAELKIPLLTDECATWKKQCEENFSKFKNEQEDRMTTKREFSKNMEVTV
jgi:hypothetical protein